jgi:NADPH-dependent FMN reductase
MKLTAISFSQAGNSLQTRGLTLLDHFLNFESAYCMQDFAIPLCYSNKPDGQVPESVLKLDSVLLEAEALVFAISEAGGHYCAAFKNVVDWLIVKNQFNSQLGNGYSLSQKPVYIVTFTPTYKDSGHRHFSMTRTLLLEKFGANVRKCHVFNQCWDHVTPKNYQFVETFCQEVLQDLITVAAEPKSSLNASSNYDTQKWLQQYEQWDHKWKTL